MTSDQEEVELSPHSRPHFGVVLLTMGTRPVELAAALDSILMQEGVTVDVVVVGNGWVPVGLPAGVNSLALPENLGIPDGRNAGVPHVSGELICFLDDDCELADVDFLARAAAFFAKHPEVGMVQPHIIDPTGLVAPSRWTPRIGSANADVSGPVTAIVEMAVVVRRGIFERTGGWAPRFFYAHEGIDLAWRVWNEDAVVWYAGDLYAHHPVIDPRRHEDAALLDARNRVWIARRNLPAVLVPLYLGTWSAISTVRRHGSERSAWWRGFRRGWSEQPVDRRPMRWKTVWRMTKSGRPPVI